ncbi:polyamine-modulated factor 1-binding protein 1 [Sardina pilchardus]|uniref:polyamine-modulated factor 1-binding protein 1 n=1 Tax=Sardina pilchardus TaxID=27697 RepID=UPI002E1455C8
MNSTHSPVRGVHRTPERVNMECSYQSFSMDREREVPQKLTPSPSKTSTQAGSSGAYLCARANSAGDSNKTTNSSGQRIEELEKLISRLNNAMLTLEEDNLKLHKRLRVGKLEMSDPEATPDDQSSNGSFRDKGAFSSEKTDRDSNTTVSQEDTHTQLRTENNSLKKKLKEAEKSCKQCARDLQRLLQKYEDLKGQNDILEQHNKQLATEKKSLEEKLGSRRSEKIQDEKLEPLRASEKAGTRVGGQTGGCRRLSFEDEKFTTTASFSMSSLATGQHEESEAAPEALARLKEENRLLKEELRRSTERGTHAEESAQALQEEQAILESCLRTVQQEKNLLQQEVKALHQDYINLSDSITLQLRERVQVDDRAPEARGSGSPARNRAPDAFTQSNSHRTELKENGPRAHRSTGSVTEKAPSMRRCTSSDSISLQLKDRVSGVCRSAGSTPDKAHDDHKRTGREETKLSTEGSPMQTVVKQGHIDKDTIERIRIRFEEKELERAQRLKSQ